MPTMNGRSPTAIVTAKDLRGALVPPISKGDPIQQMQ